MQNARHWPCAFCCKPLKTFHSISASGPQGSLINRSHKTVICHQRQHGPLSAISLQEKWSAHKLAPAQRHARKIHKHALTLETSPWGVKPLLILKQELNNARHGSQVDQTPTCYCSPVRRASLPAPARLHATLLRHLRQDWGYPPLKKGRR